jgi:hypothetical protein
MALRLGKFSAQLLPCPADNPSMPKFDPASREAEAVRLLAEQIGYGRVVQLATELWQEKEPERYERWAEAFARASRESSPTDAAAAATADRGAARSSRR